jgi:hypothetical protein
VIGPAPIVVAGLDHSGKTALRAALGAHPDITMVRHLELWTRLRSLHAAGTSRRRELLEALTGGKAASLELDRERLAQAAGDPDFGTLVVEIGEQLCDRAGARRWGLQEALVEFEAAHVLGHFPDARIVHVVRDPRQRQASMSRDGALGAGGLAAETAAWVGSARAALAAAGAWPEAFRIIRYETLLTDPERVLHEVCDFLGEDYSPAMGDAEPLTRRVANASSGTSTQMGPPPRDIAFIQERAASELAAMGYALMPLAPRAGIIRDRLVEASRWQLGRVAWWKRSRHLGRDAAPRRG